ncbi:alpha/beta fold hydrolase [uncultured Psychrobacter sp.]|uniref:alpha/beta hydrolase family protein n=1 Tax=uncultured Psychrobacter sp. TaxID=259303 RepID=UPI002627302B|nr:alpha/beta fold hydrolase [uncultured Psychrobacter sp.]
MSKLESNLNKDSKIAPVTSMGVQQTNSISNPTKSCKPTMVRCVLSVAVASSLLLMAGCGDDDTTVTTEYITSVQTVNEFNKAQINGGFGLEGTATPAAKCDIKIEKVSYPTVGAAGERTNATAALMLPSGDSADCQGDRPILLYAHGTTTEKSYDFSQVGNPQNPAGSEATLIAANFAAQGYIVVAPNYAGYDDSELDYHPYLVADQQSTDMVDALDNARVIIKKQQRSNDTKYTNIDDSGELFISGYSQGGYVAMAAARLLEQQGKPVTAIAPSSGPYALAAFGDAIFSGNVNIGATRFAPLLATGLQKKYKNIYRNSTDIFTTNYSNTQLPNLLSFGELVAANKLPDNALFEDNPQNNPTLDMLPPPTVPFAFLGFADDNYLIKTDFRTTYVADALQNPDSLLAGTGALPADSPQNNLRKALKANDLRGYIPKIPTLICGGNQDPTVYYDLNTGSMSAILQQASMSPAASLNITVLDVDATNDDDRDQNTVTSIGSAAMSNAWMNTDTIDNIQNRFATTLTAVQNQAIADAQSAGVTDPELLTQAASAAVLASYHGGLASASCTQAAREFFEQNFRQS